MLAILSYHKIGPPRADLIAFLTKAHPPAAS